MQTTSKPVTMHVVYQWTIDHDHLKGEVLCCRATLQTIPGTKTKVILKSADAIWQMGTGGWDLINADTPLEDHWPLPPRELKPRGRIAGLEPVENLFIVDNIEGRVHMTLNDNGSGLPRRIILPTNPEKVANLAAHLIAAANLDLDHDIRPLVGAILNAR